jgi:DNA-directed RNA polymerase subunit RPC12/RpoP
MRRKLFSEDKRTTTRRRLFSNDEIQVSQIDNSIQEESKAGDNIIPNDPGVRTVICADCKHSFQYDGSDLHIVCPNCGGDRFELVNELSNECVKDNAEENAVNKVFSEKRRRLFSNESSLTNETGPDPSLVELPESQESSLTTISDECDINTRYKCPDCGKVFSDESKTQSGVTCPECGGDRVERIDVLGEDQDSKLDDLLSEYEGKSVDGDELFTIMSERGIDERPKDLIDAGYATLEGDQINFSEYSSAQRKLFSKLIISVTKEFDVDPTIQDKESTIESLSGRLPGKSIMILKKAHMINPEPEVVNFSNKDFINDSGIANDLSAEYGGTSMKLKDFMNMLSEEYPDAPDDIIDLLTDDKVIKINGSNVMINK